MSMKKGKTYPNQRVYRVRTNNVPGEQRVQIDKKYIYAAYQILTPMELMIWLDISSNMKDYTWSFSPQHFNDTYGMSLSGARQAFNGLIKKGFAIQVNGSTNAFEIYSATNNSEYDEIYEALDKGKEYKEKDEDIAWSK